MIAHAVSVCLSGGAARRGRRQWDVEASTTESTENTEGVTERLKVRLPERPYPPASVGSVSSVVKGLGESHGTPEEMPCEK